MKLSGWKNRIASCGAIPWNTSSLWRTGLLASTEGRAVGCVALIRVGDGVFELAKMAVAPATRGQGVGRKLLTYVLQQARLLNAHTLVLGSSTRQRNAVHLYEALGFRHVPATELAHSLRARLGMMKLDLI